MVEYSMLETLTNVQKHYNKQEGGKDVESGTEVMDNMVERELLHSYSDWILDQIYAPDFRSSEMWYFENLRKNLAHDVNEVSFFEPISIARRHEKTEKDWTGIEEGLEEFAKRKERDYGMVVSTFPWSMLAPELAMNAGSPTRELSVVWQRYHGHFRIVVR